MRSILKEVIDRRLLLIIQRVKREFILDQTLDYGQAWRLTIALLRAMHLKRRVEQRPIQVGEAQAAQIVQHISWVDGLFEAGIEGWLHADCIVGVLAQSLQCIGVLTGLLRSFAPLFVN